MLTHKVPIKILALVAILTVQVISITTGLSFVVAETIGKGTASVLLVIVVMIS